VRHSSCSRLKGYPPTSTPTPFIMSPESRTDFCRK
jgi:hypothetical protein